MATLNDLRDIIVKNKNLVALTIIAAVFFYVAITNTVTFEGGLLDSKISGSFAPIVKAIIAAFGLTAKNPTVGMAILASVAVLLFVAPGVFIFLLGLFFFIIFALTALLTGNFTLFLIIIGLGFLVYLVTGRRR